MEPELARWVMTPNHARIRVSMARLPVLGLLLAAAAGAAHAQPATLYRCTDGPTIVFSDRPCGPDGQQISVLVPEPPDRSAGKGKPAESSDAKRIADWEKSSRSRLPASLGGKSSGTATGKPNPRRSHSAPDACAKARAALAAAEAKKRLDFAALRKYGDRVYDACKDQ